VVAGAEVSAADWLVALSDREPLALDPPTASGWFGGVALIAVDPIAGGEVPGCRDSALSDVGEILQEAFDAETPRLAVAIVPYAGDSTFAVFTGGLVREAEGGWRTWGTMSPESLPTPHPDDDAAEVPLVFEAHSDTDAAGFSAGVEAVREAVLCGDVYVLNLTRRLSARTRLDPARLFAALTAGTPASMAAAWIRPDGWLASASPERFVRLRDREVWIEPVKGTRPRGVDAQADLVLTADLLGSEKERAEHVMIVDLERNDLGRVCVPGSVVVDPLFEVESTVYCHQAVSRVSGLVRPESTIADILAATFPCGSVTGAPKIAAMRIIDQLEKSPRGAYTGSLVVAVPGSLDSSVLIRTLEGQGKQAWYGTGCGITVDSDAAEEWEESVLKTEPVLGAMPPVALRETCRVATGSVPLWTYHRERLRRGGCGKPLLAEIERAALSQAAASVAAHGRRARLSVVVTPEGAIAVEVSSRQSTLEVAGGPLGARIEVGEDVPAHGGRAKPADRAWWDAAHAIATASGAHQAILVDTRGFVIDGSTAAVWIAENGALVTAPAPPAIASVSRAFVLDAARAAGVPARVEAISWERFEVAEEAFLTNALGGCVALRGRGGPLSDRVATWFADLWPGSSRQA
jgi:branched-subunit amino acid aminotransferase/4-amino-4-deoxychorismate lyase